MPPVPAWRVRRRPSSRPDAQQRWDRASQPLLQWTQPPRPPRPPRPPHRPSNRRSRPMTLAVDARVSNQRPGQTPSIAQQVERLRARAAELGAAPPEGGAPGAAESAAAQLFRAEGSSGATLRRPGLDALRDAVAGAAVNRVLITAPDRLARNSVHQVLRRARRTRTGRRRGRVLGPTPEPRSPRPTAAADARRRRRLGVDPDGGAPAARTLGQVPCGHALALDACARRVG